MIGTLSESQHFVVRWEGEPDAPITAARTLLCANAIASLGEATLRKLANWFGLGMDDVTGHIPVPTGSPSADLAAAILGGHPFENNLSLGGVNNQITVYVGGSGSQVPGSLVPNSSGDTNLGTLPQESAVNIRNSVLQMLQETSLDLYAGAFNFGYRHDFSEVTGGTVAVPPSSGSPGLSLGFTNGRERIQASSNAIYVGTGATNGLADLAAMEVVLSLFTTELAELLMDYKYWIYSSCENGFLPYGGNIWNPGKSDGEALSRFLSRSIWTYGMDTWELQTGTPSLRGIVDHWTQPPSARVDFSTDAQGGGRDSDFPQVGYGVLFLYFLRSYLGVSISNIIQSAYPPMFNDSYTSTYQETYHALLLGRNIPLAYPAPTFSTEMINLLNLLLPVGVVSTSDDPFAINPMLSTIYTTDMGG